MSYFAAILGAVWLAAMALLSVAHVGAYWGWGGA
jgi:hypothetical protein